MSTPPTSLVNKSQKRVLAVVGFLVFVEFSSGFLQGYYVPLLNNIRDHLGVTDASIAWFITVQTLAAGVCVPILAKLGDIFGHRRMLRIGIVSVLVGTVLVAFAPSFPSSSWAASSPDRWQSGCHWNWRSSITRSKARPHAEPSACSSPR